ncbi:MAG: hypothetical protein AAF235_07945 [Planctomycetota bacterium]
MIESHLASWEPANQADILHELDLIFYASEIAAGADLAPPYGVLNSSDINAFVAEFLAETSGADLREPYYVHNSSDISGFVNEFIGAGGTLTAEDVENIGEAIDAANGTN